MSLQDNEKNKRLHETIESLGDQRAGQQPSVIASGCGVSVQERLCCPRCKEETTFEISVKDAPGLWITCASCHWVINSAIKPEEQKQQPSAEGTDEVAQLDIPNPENQSKMPDNVPRVVHCKREPYDVYIGRPSKWGNPIILANNTLAERRIVLVAYRSLVESGYLGDVLGSDWREIIKKELRGKVLGCWCSPKPCHGDVLLEVANG
jgi:uncharacterized protein DUF4326